MRSDANFSSENNSESSSIMMSQIQDKRNDNYDESKIYIGVDKSIREWKRVNRIFRKNECQKSLYFIPQTNRFRIWYIIII